LRKGREASLLLYYGGRGKHMNQAIQQFVSSPTCGLLRHSGPRQQQTFQQGYFVPMEYKLKFHIQLSIYNIKVHHIQCKFQLADQN
jgi:hypothetical protein